MQAPQLDNVTSSNTAEAVAGPARGISEALDALASMNEGRGATLGAIVDELRSNGNALLCLVLSLPFIQPVPLAGLSTVLGSIIVLLGILLAMSRPPWLPERLRQRAVPGVLMSRVAQTGQGVMKRMARFLSRRRAPLLFRSAPARATAGIVIAVNAALLALPLPIPFSNMLPALSIIGVSLGLLEEDGMVVAGGYLMAIGSLVYFAALVLVPMAVVGGA